MTSDQVRWKMNALLKKYKEIIDNCSKSGRGNIEFEWFEQMDEIFGKKNKIAHANYTVSSKILSKDKTSTSQRLGKKKITEPLPSTSQNFEEANSRKAVSKLSKKTTNTDILPNAGENSDTFKLEKHTPRGTGSKIAKNKLILEEQWIRHLTQKEERDCKKNEKYASFIESKKETVKLKRKQLELKEQELQQQREIAEKKLKEKKSLHAQMLEIEKQKYNVLKRYFDNKGNIIKRRQIFRFGLKLRKMCFIHISFCFNVLKFKKYIIALQSYLIII